MANQDRCGTARIAGAVEQAGSTIAGKAEQAWNATRQEAQQLSSNVAQSAENAWKEVDQFIRRYPLMVFVGGFAVGFLVRQALLSRTPEMTRRMSHFSA